MTNETETQDQDFLRWQAEWDKQEVLEMEVVMTNLNTRRRRQRQAQVSNIVSNGFIVAMGVWLISRVGWSDPTGLLFVGVGALALVWQLVQDRGLQVSLVSARDHVGELKGYEESIVSRFERGKWLVFPMTAMIFAWAFAMLTQGTEAWRVAVALVSVVAPMAIYFGARRQAQKSRERLKNLDHLISDADRN